MFAGALGSLIGCPCDLVLVRMQADKRPGISDAERRNYKGLFDAFKRIVSEEGIKSLWTGGTMTIVRAISMNVSMLVSYAEAKERISAYYAG